MRKVFSLMLVALFVTAVGISGAWASTVALGTAAEIANGTYTYSQRTIAAESFARNYDVDLDDAVKTINAVGAGNNPLVDAGDKLGIEASWGMNAGDIITITFNNARYMDGDAYLIAEEAAAEQPTAGACDFNNDSDNLDVVEIASNFGSLDSTNGVTTVTLRVNNGLVLPTGMQMVLVSSTASTEDGGDGVIDNDTDNPVLRIPLGTAAGVNVYVQVSAVTSGGVAIGAATCIGYIMGTETQFDFAVANAGTSVVDVDAAAGSRFAFVEEGVAGDIITSANDTDLTAAAGTYTFSNDANGSIEDFITLVAADSLDLTLTSSTDLSEVDYSSNRVYAEMGNGGSGTTNETNYDFAYDTATTLVENIAGDDVDTAVPENNSYTDDIYIGVEGDGSIDVRTWTLDADLNFNDLQYTDHDWNAATISTWSLNGYQAKIPYMLAKTDKHTVLRLVNQGSESADVTIELMGPSGETATVEYTGADGVPANGSKFYTALDIVDDASGWTGGDIFTATVTMNSGNSQSMIEAYVWSDLGYRPTTTYDTRSPVANAAGQGFSK